MEGDCCALDEGGNYSEAHSRHGVCRSPHACAHNRQDGKGGISYKAGRSKRQAKQPDLHDRKIKGFGGSDNRLHPVDKEHGAEQDLKKRHGCRKKGAVTDSEQYRGVHQAERRECRP